MKNFIQHRNELKTLLKRTFVLLLFIIFSNHTIGQSKIIIDSISTKDSNFIFAIKKNKDYKVNSTILLYDSLHNKLFSINNRTNDKNNYYFDLGGNKNEGNYIGSYTTNGDGIISISYKGGDYLTILNNNKEWNFKQDNNKVLEIPLEINNSSSSNIKIKSAFFDISKKGSSTPVFIFKNDNSNFDNIPPGKSRKIIKNIFKWDIAGNYEGSLNFVDNDNIKHQRKLKLEIRHSFWMVFWIFIFSILFGEIIKHVSKNEKKTILLDKAQELYLKGEKLLDTSNPQKEDFLKEVKSFITEINAWLLTEEYYIKILDSLNKKLSDLIKTIDRQKEMGFAPNPLDEENKMITFLKIKRWFIHFLISVAIGMIAFNTLYCNNPIFGAEGLWDYLVLIFTAIAISYSSGNLITERLTGIFGKLKIKI